MKVIELRDRYDIEGLVLAEVPAAEVNSGEVLVRIGACSINYRDLLIVRGYGRWRKPLPLVPLSDAAGRVVEVGPGVSRVAVGNRVASTFVPSWQDGELTDANDGPAVGGMLSEYRVLSEEALVQIPQHMNYVEAATLPCAALTAWNALTGEGAPRPGDTVVVLGSGGVSLFALQLAVLMGARVIATSRSGLKREKLKQLGATHVIDPNDKLSWPEMVLEVTRGRGADYVVDVVGRLADSVRAVRMGGVIGVIGMLDGFSTEIDPAAIMTKNARLRGLQVGSRRMFETMNRALFQHHLRPVIDRVYPFAESQAAFRRLETGDHFGKICIQVWPDDDKQEGDFQIGSMLRQTSR